MLGKNCSTLHNKKLINTNKKILFYLVILTSNTFNLIRALYRKTFIEIKCVHKCFLYGKKNLKQT